MIKKTLIITTSLLILTFTACAKSKAAAPANKETSAGSTSTAAAQPKVNPEIEKLNRVLFSMSDRCKAVIPNGDPEEFLSDLHKVLDSASEFSADDLSPFYPTIKHTLETHLLSFYKLRTPFVLSLHSP